MHKISKYTKKLIVIFFNLILKFILFPIKVFKIWIKSGWESLIGPKGYLIIPTIIASYIGAYTIVEAMHARSLNYSSFERSTFMTLVSSGNKASFISAMKYFGDVQTIKVKKEPEIFNATSWLETNQPNLKPMWRWCLQYLEQCDALNCGDMKNNIRIDLSQARMNEAMLIGVNLNHSNLYKAWLINTDLSESNLSSSYLNEAYLNGVILEDADLRNAKFEYTILIGGNLEDANAEGASFKGADFEKAILLGTNFTNANLQNANLFKAEIGGPGNWSTTFLDANLSGATWINGKKCAANSIGQCN